jgi:penicillin-binding protein 1A
MWQQQAMPHIDDIRETVLDSGTAYQIVSFLQGVVQRGTGVRIRAVGKPLAGKTGTTNESQDTWFIGFSPDLVVGVFAGFDQPSSLGKKETGSSVTAPIFRDFFKQALEGKPAIPFRIPPEISLVRVNAKTGLPTSPDDRNVILEAFKPGTEPTATRSVLDGSSQMEQMGNQSPVGTGGLY